MKSLAAIVCFILFIVLGSACAPAQSGGPSVPSPEPSSNSILQPSPVPATRVASSNLDQQRTQLYAADEVARLTAIAQLEANGSPEAVMILGTFFMDSNVRGRLEAVRALLRINSVQAQSYIRTAMSDKQLTGRRQVAMQALEADSKAAYPILGLLITDSDETVRLNTVQVVEFLGTAQGRVLLQRAMKDSSPAVQQAAIQALRALGFSPTPNP